MSSSDSVAPRAGASPSAEEGSPSGSRPLDEPSDGPSAERTSERTARPTRLSTAGVTSWAAAGTAIAVAALLGYRKRWMTDDGMIYVRAVRQILAGNGPVYNLGERAESSTGTLWQWILASVSQVTTISVDKTAIYLGLFLFVGALTLGSFASRSFSIVVSAPPQVWTVPFGLLVVVALPPFWDFATSGLETSLTYFWIAAGWTLLVRSIRAPAGRLDWLSAVWLGLGPLIRPDMALVSVIFFCALPGLRPFARRLRTGSLILAGAALPLAYQVFRMGYYGEILPLPAYTKEADQSHWSSGLHYLADFVSPYQLLLPIGMAVVVFAILARALSADRDRVVVAAAPIVAGVLSGVYVVRVGGDFMHARMLLPATFLIALPIFVLRVTRQSVAVICVMSLWAGLCVTNLRMPYPAQISGDIADERGIYTTTLGTEHPIAVDYANAFDRVEHVNQVGDDSGTIELGTILYPGNAALPLGADSPYGAAYVFPQLGMSGAAVPLADGAIDQLGLAYPLVAHFESVPGARTGHAKSVTVEWIIADFTDPGTPLPVGVDPRRVAAARHALTCGPIADLLRAARAPMSLSRFWSNLTSALGRNSLRIPQDPLQAEKKFC